MASTGFLLNAAPDLRAQINGTPALHPARRQPRQPDFPLWC